MKNVLVANVLGTTPLNMAFRRALLWEKLLDWFRLVALVLPIKLNENEDVFLWRLSKNGLFSTQSLYKDIMGRARNPGKCSFWKAKLPLKIKIFLWYLKRKVVLTKDNKLKRGWKGETKCSFCDMAETIQHLFLECHVAKVVWNSLFLAFNNKPPKDISHSLVLG